jgi:sigma-B regulation protein RsbU (phosphoserine phosphatase)
MFAVEMQTTLVPPLYYRGDCIEAYGQSIPIDDVGGDLMDLVSDGPELTVYVSDVSGHGLRAGVLMGMIKTAMRYGVLLRRPLRNLVSDLNRLLPQVKSPGMFATLAALRFDGSKDVEYVSAGHVPLLHFRKKSNDVIRHYAQQFPLGLLACDAPFSRSIRFEPGDIFLLPTDGAVETGEERDLEIGLKILARTLRQFHQDPLAEILEMLKDEIRRHGPENDDRTLLLLRALSGRGNHEQAIPRWQPSNEQKWQRMLADLAAGLTGD